MYTTSERNIMPILKNIKKEKDFVQIHNTLARKEDLTYEAKGLLLELLSRPANWVIRKKQLIRSHTKEAKITRILKELQSKKYFRIFQIRNGNNQRIEDRIWVVSEEPKTEKEWSLILENLRLRESSEDELENLRLRESSSNNTVKNTNKENKENNKKRNDFSPNLSDLSPKKQKQVEDIFLYWNLHKGEKGWHSHNKITFDIKDAIIENLKKYPMVEICCAIDNYAKVLTGEEYFWEHTWPLGVFLTVKTGLKTDAPKKWWQFHPENFVENNYINKYGKQIDKREEKLLEDKYAELTAEIICKYRELIGSPNYTITPAREQKFIKASIKLVAFWELNKMGAANSICVDHLMECLNAHYINQGKKVEPGHLCGEHTWDTLMPQHLKGLGIWHNKKE
jgi:hypothetical protein